LPNSELTAQERRLELVLRLLALLFAGFVASYLIGGITHEPTEFPFVANSVAKDGMFAILAFLAGGDIRRNGWAGWLVVAGHALIVASLLLMLALGRTDSIEATFGSPLGLDPDPTTFLLIWAAAASAIVVALTLLYRSAARARYRLRYLAPHQHRTAMAVAEVMVIGPDELLTPEQVAEGIDDYLASFSARGKGKAKLALSALTVYPLLRGRPPFALMSPERRLEFIERCFHRDVVERRLPGFLRKPVQSVLFGAQQLAVIGYYGDPRTTPGTGYVPFSKRPRYREEIKKVDPNRPGLNVHSPNEVDGERVSADVAIVGSGAAGSILAQRLLEAGREVTIIEGGRHVDPHDFSEDERVQFSALFSDGGMQMSKDARFQVLQAKCVGGGTVINNAVCFDLTDPSLDRWNDPDGLDAGINKDRLDDSFERIRGFFPVRKQDDAPLNRGGTKLVEGVEKLGLPTDEHFGVVEANIDGCLGSGYCNIGCPFGVKLDALAFTLPRAQIRFEDALRVYSECWAEKVKPSRNGSGAQVRCRLSDGRRLQVDAKTVVVSAGALASSLLLQRSRLGGKRVGTGLSFNVGAPMTGDFTERLDSFDGLQISHAYKPPNEDQLIYEAWFNPVGTQALLMPGWFSDHYENMRRYAYMACVGVVVGSESNGSVKPGFRGRGMKLEYEPTDGDLKLMIRGNKTAGRILLAAGARRVMPLTFRSLSYTAAEQLDELDEVVKDNTDIQLHTSHPMGGNAISRDPDKGVVDERFAVRGAPGVYVCDASVFPAAATVNPQLTVMALADYAAPAIAAA